MADETDDIFKRWEEQEALLAKQVRIEDGHIVIDVSYEYNIPLDRCDTPEKVLSWMVHLCEKTWMNTLVLERFAKVASQKGGFEIKLA